MKKIVVLAALALLACGSDRDAFTENQPPPNDSLQDPAAGGCEKIEATSYMGCEAWPTPVANAVWSTFDFAVVVANAGEIAAEVTIDRAGQSVAKATVPPNGLSKIYLPWVKELKGADSDHCGSVLSALPQSVRVDGGAYHLKSSRPVTVYQFSALEYAPVGGPPQKDWTSCPGYLGCNGIDCYSYTNDASILFPTAALSGTYRVTGIPSGTGNAYFAITATKDGTNVKVRLSGTARVLKGKGIPETVENGTLTFTMNAGDVVELAAPQGATDLSGSLVDADKPVQVIAGHPCQSVPAGIPACDHLEQSVAPAQTLGKHYFVAQPTGPYGGIPGHVVRLYGNVDGTTLTYPRGAPKNAPAKIDAGEVVDLGVVDQDFEIIGDHELAIATFMMGGQALDPSTGQGDPSQSIVVPVEQFRSKYVFLAPDDYDTSWVDAIAPMGATLTLDGAPVAQVPKEIGTGSGFGIARIRLEQGAHKGAHVLEGSAPFGIQVVGYGKFTSYQYPGGLDLKPIAPPPVR
jgi:hypothetical protein